MNFVYDWCYESDGKNDIIYAKYLGVLYPLNGSAAGRGTKRTKDLDRSCRKGGWLSTGEPGVRDVRGAQANPHSVRDISVLRSIRNFAKVKSKRNTMIALRGAIHVACFHHHVYLKAFGDASEQTW